MELIKASLVREGDYIKVKEGDSYAQVVCIEHREETLLIRFHLKRLCDSDKPYLDVIFNHDVIKKV